MASGYWLRRNSLPGRAWAVAAIVLATFLTSEMASAEDSAAVRPIVLAADGDAMTFGSRWVRLIYDEAFKRLGIPFQLEHYTLARRAALVEEGYIDGETSRIHSYGDTRPHLVRVEESLIDLSFALYTANPAVHLKSVENLRSSDYRVEFRRGILICENNLRPVVAAERLSDVLTTEQGLKKLVAKRADLYCDIDVYVLQGLQSPDIKGAAVRKVVSIGKAVPTYPYLNKKHAVLAPRLAAVLRQMKAEGLVDAYRVQVERDLGWIK